MKRLVRTMAVMLVLSASVAMQAATKAPLSTTNLEVQQQKKYVVVNGNGVRLRFEPNLNSSWLRYDNGSVHCEISMDILPGLENITTVLPFTGYPDRYFMTTKQNCMPCEGFLRSRPS